MREGEKGGGGGVLGKLRARTETRCGDALKRGTSDWRIRRRNCIAWGEVEKTQTSAQYKNHFYIFHLSLSLFLPPVAAAASLALLLSRAELATAATATVVAVVGAVRLLLPLAARLAAGRRMKFGTGEERATERNVRGENG